MLRSLDEQSRDEAHRILLLLCYSDYPLTVCQIIDALAIDIEHEVYDEARRLNSSEDLLQICSGMIEIEMPMLGLLVDEEVRRVRIAHFSVQEYLTSTRLPRDLTADFFLEANLGQFEIAQLCLISFIAAENSVEVPRGSWLQYGLGYWTNHTERLSNNAALINRLHPLLMRIFTENEGIHSEVFGTITEIAENDELESLWAEHRLDMAAEIGLRDVLSELLPRAGANYDASFAIKEAAYGGHLEVVQMLLDRATDTTYALLTVCGCPYDRVDMIKLLSGSGTHDMQMVLEHASGFACKENLVAVISLGANDLDSAMEAAARSNNMENVRLLISLGATSFDRCLRAAASTAGSNEICEWMLHHGATDINGALKVAASSGLTSIVDMMIARGADDFNGALLAAASTGGDWLVELFLRQGATDLDNALLAAAAGWGTRAIAEMLIARGAANSEDALAALQTKPPRTDLSKLGNEYYQTATRELQSFLSEKCAEAKSSSDKLAAITSVGTIEGTEDITKDAENLQLMVSHPARRQG